MANKSRINLRIRVTFEDLGEGWSKEHYVIMNNVKFKDLPKFAKLGVKEGADISAENIAGIVEIIKEKFVEGSIPVPVNDDDPFGPSKTVPMEADDLDDLSIGIVSEIIEKCMGKLGPKSSKNSNLPSTTTELKSSDQKQIS